MPGGLAGASAVVDKTVQAATQALIALLGVGLLITEFGTRLVPAALGGADDCRMDTRIAHRSENFVFEMGHVGSPSLGGFASGSP
ncbi:MAG: hypothetical protein V3R89_06060 [Thermoanaerobaculia bacterium]